MTVLTRIMSLIADWLALLGGWRAMRRRTVAGSVLLGLWWAVLFALIIATAGRATKFIYVDF